MKGIVMTWNEIKSSIDQKIIDGGFDANTDEILYIDFSGEPSDIITATNGDLIIE